MSSIVTRIVAYAIGAVVVLGGTYIGIDSIVGAFRDRAALQAKVEGLERAARQRDAELQAAWADAEAARQDAEHARQEARAERVLRDRLAREAKAREAKNAKELNDAKERLARWMRDATPDLQRCLAMPVPDDVVVGLQRAGEAGSDADVHAEDGSRVPHAAGGIPRGQRGAAAEGRDDRRQAHEPAGFAGVGEAATQPASGHPRMVIEHARQGSPLSAPRVASADANAAIGLLGDFGG